MKNIKISRVYLRIGRKFNFRKIYLFIYLLMTEVLGIELRISSMLVKSVTPHLLISKKRNDVKHHINK
jgi:hypothetical protein